MKEQGEAKDITKALYSTAMEYPEHMREMQIQDIERVAYHISLVYGKGKRILDIGGGVGLFSPGCAVFGMTVFLLDDFRDEINRREGDSILDLHRTKGISIISGDAPSIELVKYLGNYKHRFDCITSFDSMEHFHHSPRRLFHQIKRLLKEDGYFLVGVPNAVDILSRLRVLFGISCWSKFEDWYYPEEFRGHVREVTVRDLLLIAKDMGFKKLKIFGANWVLRKRHPAILARCFDNVLRKVPSLCSDIYLLASDYERSPIDGFLEYRRVKSAG